MDPIHPIRPSGAHPAPVQRVPRVARVDGEAQRDEDTPRRERPRARPVPAPPPPAGDGHLDALA